MILPDTVLLPTPPLPDAIAIICLARDAIIGVKSQDNILL